MKLPKRIQRLLLVLVTATLVATACGSSAADATPTTEAPSTPSSDSGAAASADEREPDASAATAALDPDTYFSFGNPDAETVIVIAQGGPVPSHETEDARDMFSGVDRDRTHIVLPHQVQTLDPDRFVAEEISFDQAKELDTETTQLIGNVVEGFVAQDRHVIVVGVSFGAFVVQDLLATQGNIADGYLIQVGRLDMPAEVWEPFSQGRFVGFIDGVEIATVDADGAGMGGDGDFTDTNMAKLAAGLGHKRYTELLADVDLSNVVYAYGEVDEQVGRLTTEELAFLEAKGVRVLSIDGGHGEAIDGTLQPGLDMLLQSTVFTGGEPADNETAGDNEDIGYLPADQVESYVAAFEAGLAESSVTIDGVTLPVRYAGVESGITISTDDSHVVLELDDDGLAGANVEWNGRQWLVQQEPEVLGLPEALGGDGDVLSMAFPAFAADNAADRIDVALEFNVNMIGMGASTVEVVDGYATISGTLGTSTYVQLRDVIANNPNVDTLVMLNVHGSENDEINVHTARLIRAAGWTTWVPSNGDISSGGVDMFVAGVTRIVEPGGFVGIHSWGSADGEQTGRDFPKDSPVHRSQLEYFIEMMGEEAGPDFYFATLDAAPFDQIYRMTPQDMADHGLITADAPQPLPASVIGQPAGYLQVAEGTYLKVQVAACQIEGANVAAELESVELGPIELTAADGAGEVSIPFVEGLAPVGHDLTEVTVEGGVVSGTINLDLGALIDLDTSNATFELPCAA